MVCINSWLFGILRSRIQVSYSVAGAYQTEFTNTASITLANTGAGEPYPSTIDVSGLSGTIEAIKVSLHNVSHTYPSDLDVLLVGPDGESLILMSDAGGANAFVDVGLEFDDDASRVLAAAGPITAGVYRPTNYDADDSFPNAPELANHGLALDVFAGTDPNGTWSLYVVDDEDFDSGEIAGGWSLVIEATPETTAWKPQGWMYYSWPYAYSWTQERWYYFDVSNTSGA